MDDKFKELLGEEGQTIEKFKKGTYINKDDFKELMNNHFEKMSMREVIDIILSVLAIFNLTLIVLSAIGVIPDYFMLTGAIYAVSHLVYMYVNSERLFK